MKCELPLVSVVVPTFNCAETIAKSIASILGQTYPNLEVIIVDDASLDGTRDVVKEICKRDSRVSLFSLPINSGTPAAPRNRGLGRAQGELVAFLDGDDSWAKYKLEQQVKALLSQPRLAVVHGALWERARLAPLRGLIYLPDPHRRRGGRRILARRNIVQCSSVLAWTSVIREAGGFNEGPELRSVEDYELWYRLARQGRHFGYVCGIMGTYRVHADGISQSEDWQGRHRVLNELYGHDVDLSGGSHWGRVLRRITGFPRAVFHHLIEAPLRRSLRMGPRVFLDVED